ncbi:MAG: HAD family hydrolase [Egibacteraceae bacterium]
MRERAAFFDVDDTLIAVKSMFCFLEYDMAASGRPPSDYRRAIDELRCLKAAGAPRSETNRAFYANFVGRYEDELAARGVEWFQAEHQRGGLFNDQVLSVLRRHARAGELIALVSGSFPPCLDPIADFVGADLLLCSRPEVRDGRYSGELAMPMIGEGKAGAVRAEAAARGIALEHSSAYGDHVSDLPLLEVVGHPVVVGDDPGLNDHAIRRGWRRWPGAVAQEVA